MEDPAPATSVRSCRESLHDLLCASLSPDELRTLARAIGDRGGDDSIVYSLATGNVRDMASELITLIHQRGLEYELFMELSRLRPRRYSRIAALARRFRVEPPPPSPPRPGLISAPLLPEAARARAVARPHDPSPRLLAALLAVGLGMTALGIGVLLAMFVTPPVPLRGPFSDTSPSLRRSSPGEPVLGPHAPVDRPPLSPATEQACARPDVHEAPLQQRHELLLVSSRRPKNTAWMTFAVDLDAGEAARHILSHHFLHIDEQLVALLTNDRLKLCVLDGCAGSGTPISVLFSGRGPAHDRPVGAANTESKAGLRKDLASPPRPTAKTDAPAHDGEKALSDATVPTVGFVLLDQAVFFHSDQPRSALSCTDWSLACARTVALPAGAGSDEFTISIRLRLVPRDPRSLSASVEPYSEDCWWRGEQPLLADERGACGEAPRFGLFLRHDGGLHWLLEDGADVGPGRAWAIDAPASAPGGVLDARWHTVALVRRFGEDGDVALELWLDGALQGVELSSSRDDLADRWLAPDARLRAPWYWFLNGDLGMMHVWEYALAEEELAKAAPTQVP